jgi:hypothetical protein
MFEIQEECPPVLLVATFNSPRTTYALNWLMGHFHHPNILYILEIYIGKLTATGHVSVILVFSLIYPKMRPSALPS